MQPSVLIFLVAIAVGAQAAPMESFNPVEGSQLAHDLVLVKRADGDEREPIPDLERTPTIQIPYPKDPETPPTAKFVSEAGSGETGTFGRTLAGIFDRFRLPGMLALDA